MLRASRNADARVNDHRTLGVLLLRRRRVRCLGVHGYGLCASFARSERSESRQSEGNDSRSGSTADDTSMRQRRAVRLVP